MGFFDVFKKSRRQVNRENQEQGKAGERKIKSEYEFSGYKVTRTGKGHDLKAEKKDWFGNKTTKYIEVKTGNSKLSKIQKKKRGQMGDKYVVERLEPTPFGLSTNNRESDLSSKRKKNSSNIFGFGNSNVWNSSTTKKKSTPKKKQSSMFGSSSVDSFFGSGSSKRGSSKKKSDSIWGSDTTSKRKKSRRSNSDSIFGSSSSSIWGSGKRKKFKL